MSKNAHSANKAGIPQTVKDHLQSVASIARDFAYWHKDETYLAGLLHDLGKYGDLFQLRLQGKTEKIDHWSAGGNYAARYGCYAAGMVAYGHHVGLKSFDHIMELMTRPVDLLSDGRRYSDNDFPKLLKEMKQDGLKPVKPEHPSRVNFDPKTIGSMLDTRMMFSCVTDADFLDTEAHAIGGIDGKHYRKQNILLQPDVAFKLLCDFRDAKPKTASHEMNEIRERLWNCCVADYPVGTYKIGAPTGSGKTLSMLGFALNHARQHNMSRIIMVVPYLSIIEQTAAEYRRIFSEHFGIEYLLEHHSLTDYAKNDRHDNRYVYAQNWDAPIIITTNVQFFESMFADKSSRCRKLHNIANSVILFDEIQSLPVGLALPTISALDYLSKKYHSTIVFSTATQPNMWRLGNKIENDMTLNCDGMVCWKPIEIVADKKSMFDHLRRVKVEWLDSYDQNKLLTEIEQNKQSAIIFNTKKMAIDFTEKLIARGVNDVYHFSTNICPAHRSIKLAEIRERLLANLPVRLVATQCIEAGVDVDFPTLYRAMAPLDAIIQSAGRCNRNGKLQQLGRMVVFDTGSSQNLYPDVDYLKSTSFTRLLFRKYDGLDIDDPSIFDEYYDMVIRYCGGFDNNRLEDVMNGIRACDFEVVAEHYRIIDQATISVIVNYDEKLFKNANVLPQPDMKTGKRSWRQWFKTVRPITCQIFQPKPSSPSWDNMTAVHKDIDNWYFWNGQYSEIYGLVVPPELMIG